MVATAGFPNAEGYENMQLQSPPQSRMEANVIVSNEAHRVALDSKSLRTMEGDEMQMETYMAVCHGKGRLGIAYYEQEYGKLYVVEGSEDFDWENPSAKQFPFLRRIRHQINPTAVFVSSRADECLITALDETKLKDSESEDPSLESSDVILEKSGNFETSAALEILSRVELEEMPGDLPPQERLQFLNSIFSLSNEQLTRAAGGLLRIMEREGLLLHMQMQGQGSTSRVFVREIKQLQADGFLILEQATYTALHIFQEERHPSCMGLGGSKEGFSMYTLLNRCITQMGRRLLKTWMTRPILNLDTINSRLDAVDFLVKDCVGIVQELSDGLKEVRDVPKIINRLRGASCQLDCLRDWCKLASSILAFVRIREAAVTFSLSQRNHAPGQKPPGLVNNILRGIDENLSGLYTLIKEIINLQELDEDGVASMVVSSGLSSELDNMRQQYTKLQDELTAVVEMEFQKIPTCLQRQEWAQQQWSVVLIPQLGYLMQISGGGYDPILADIFSDYRLAFQTMDSVYYHTAATDELNETYGDLYNKIRDIENSILHELLAKVMDHCPALLAASSTMAEVDCQLSFAKVAREHNYFRPTLTMDNVLHIENGRHPLGELSVECFVPNSTHISDTEHRIQVLTGPNYAGKSIYGKQVALIAYMAHLGCFVPADSCKIGLIDRIFTRIASKETMNIPQSAFMIDLTQVSNMLHNFTPRSLLIIDEFGKGTHSQDGLALLSSTLDYLGSKPLPPKVIACTHFSELSDAEILTPSRYISHVTMEYICHVQEDGPVQQLVYLYKVAEGTATSSFGIQCGRLAGVDEQVLSRAQQVIELLERNQQIGRMMSIEAEARDKSCLDIARTFANLDANDAQQILDFLEKCC